MARDDRGVVMFRSSGTAQFDVGKFKMSVDHFDRDGAKATAFAHDLLDSGGAMVRRDNEIAALRTQMAEAKIAHENAVRVLQMRVAALRAQIPEVPARILSTGTVRFLNGEIWLLSKRETGWSSFGVRVGSWDELFRRFNVVVTEHGTDKHGAWWSVENAKGGE